MWIAKPLQSLSKSELGQAFSRSGLQLAQTYRWQLATESAGAQTYLVLQMEEGWGGFVHSFDGKHFECTNGPMLDWDNPDRATAQLATFAQAVSRLSKSFQSMNLSPRWNSTDLSRRLSYLPIEPSATLEAATIQIPIEASFDSQLRKASPRLRRTLERSVREGVQTQWLEIQPSLLEEFVADLNQFGQKKSFFVPPLNWFQTLVFEEPEIEKISFRMVESWTEPNIHSSPMRRSLTRLMIAITPEGWHYLFGYDIREGNGAISTSAAAHFRVLLECIKSGATYYDLNGFTDPNDSSHPYAGVSEFKAQFGGRVIHFACPQFQIA